MDADRIVVLEDGRARWNAYEELLQTDIYRELYESQVGGTAEMSAVARAAGPAAPTGPTAPASTPANHPKGGHRCPVEEAPQCPKRPAPHAEKVSLIPGTRPLAKWSCAVLVRCDRRGKLAGTYTVIKPVVDAVGAGDWTFRAPCRAHRRHLRGGRRRAWVTPDHGPRSSRVVFDIRRDLLCHIETLVVWTARATAT